MKTKFILKAVILLSILSSTTINIWAQSLGSLSFDGSDDYIEVTESPLNIIGTDNFTFEAWVKGDEAEQSSHPTIFSNRGANPFGGGIIFFFHNKWGGSHSKLLCFQVNAQNYLLVDNGTYDASILDNECHHVAITKDGTELSFYIDGAFVGTRAISVNASVDFNSPLWIGRDRAGGYPFKGLISQCRIWNVARTEAEILENKDNNLQGEEEGLIAYWEMGEVDGQTLADKTGNGFDGILGNGYDADSKDPLWSEEGCTVTSNADIEVLPLKIYPNPTFDLITVENLNSSTVQIQLTHQTGKLIVSQTTNSEHFNIDLSSYPAGIYYMSVIYNKVVLTKKIVRY